MNANCSRPPLFPQRELAPIFVLPFTPPLQVDMKSDDAATGGFWHMP
jgi:hypothetical protein